MANVKNAKKKIKQIEKTTKANEQLKSTVKNSIKRTDKAVLAGDKEKAEKILGNKGRVLLRKSGTEPLVRVMVEGEDGNLVKELASRIADVIVKQSQS